MSLLDDVSIVVTPNGYKAGELYAVVPVPTEGAEEIVNGDFASDLTGWSDYGTASATGGVATIGASANSGIFQNNILTNGLQYEVIVNVTSYNGVGTAQLANQNGNNIYTITETGIKTFTYTHNIALGQIILRGMSNALFSVSSVSVKEYTAADMDVTRATAATRVDEAGLVNYAEIIGSDLVTDGDFGSGSNWYEGTGCTISGNQGIYTSAPSGSGFTGNNVNSGIFTIGKRYTVVFTIDSISLGALKIRKPFNSSTTYTEVGTYTETVIATDVDIYIQNSGTTTASISNVSVKEVTRDNVPRIDYTGGGCPHILAEPQRTNLITYSEDFSQSDWRKDKVTVTSDSIISPSGELNASLIQETVYTGGIPSFDLLNSITLAASSHTFSFYVKNNSGRYLGISFGSSAQRVRTNFDFNTNTFKTLLLSGTTTGSASFTTLGDFYRITITATFPSSTAADTVFMPLASDTYPFFAFQDSDNRSFHLWGTQLESSYATSYIPTSGSTVTRNQDQFSRDGIGSLINSEEGVLFVEMAALVEVDTNRRFITLNDGGASNNVVLRYEATGVITARYQVGGVAQCSIAFATTITNSHKIAFKYKVNDFSLWIDGTEVGTDTSGSVLAADTINKISFDSGNGSFPFFGKVKQLQVYKTALTDAQLTSLTS